MKNEKFVLYISDEEYLFNELVLSKSIQNVQ